MFGFFERIFILLLSICTTNLSFGGALPSDHIKCISLNNRPCKAISILVDINSNAPLYYPFILSVSKSRGSCNTIDDLYARICVSNKVKNTNVKVFNFIFGVDETRFLVQCVFCAFK